MFMLLLFKWTEVKTNSMVPYLVYCETSDEILHNRNKDLISPVPENILYCVPYNDSVILLFLQTLSELVL